MKKHLLLLALLLAGVWTVQAQNLNWAAAFGGSTFAAGKAIATDPSGNVYSTGYFYGTSDFDPSLGTVSFTAAPAFGCDLYISKLNANATLGWAKQISSDGNDYGTGIAVDQTSGDVYVTGWFHGPTDFDPGVDSFIVNAPAADALFVLKLDAAGDFVWVRTLEGSSSYGLAIALDATGNVVIGGNFDGTVDFDPGTGAANATATASLDAFVLQLDANGNHLLDLQFGGTGYDEVLAIAVDGSGNMYVTGGFDGTIDIDLGTGTTSYTADGSDIYVSKFDNVGNLVWGGQMGGPGSEFGKAIGVDGSGNVYMTGKFTGTVDFDPGSGGTSYTADGFSDAFLTRLDANGNLIWATKVGGPGLDEGTALTIDALGSIVWTGGFQDTVDFEIGGGVTNLNNELGTDIFVAKYNPNLSFGWAKNMGGNGTDWGYAIALDGNDNVCLTGQFTDQCDFDPNAGTANLTSLGENDIYVMKLSLPAVSQDEALSPTDFSVYPNPTSGVLRINVSRISMLSIVNTMGQEMVRINADAQASVDVSNFDAGIYFVVDRETGKALKFVKQ
jgi:hypothetical protein